MTTPVIGQTSTTKVVPYLSNAMFATHARRGVSIDNLVPGGSEADQKAALADYIRRASAMADAFLLGTLASTVDTEVGPVTIRPDGVAVIKPRFRPIIALTAFAAGRVGALTEYTELSGAQVEPERILLPVGPFGVWRTSQGPLQFGPPAPVPGSLYARWTTCNGWPVTWLTAGAALNANTIDVADTTGIIAGQTQLTLYAGAYRYVFVPTAVSTAGSTGFGTGPGTLSLPTPLPLAVTNDPLYPTYVSALPDDVNMAIVLGTRGLIKKTGGGNISSPTSQQAKSADPYGANDDLAQMYDIIDTYQMVQQ